MTLERMAIYAFTAIFAAFAYGGWRRGRFDGIGGIAYATREKQPYLFAGVLAAHIAMAVFLAAILIATGSER